MNKKLYRSAFDSLRVSDDFVERTQKLLAEAETNRGESAQPEADDAGVEKPARSPRIALAPRYRRWIALAAAAVAICVVAIPFLSSRGGLGAKSAAYDQALPESASYEEATAYTTAEAAEEESGSVQKSTVETPSAEDTAPQSTDENAPEEVPEPDGLVSGLTLAGDPEQLAEAESLLAEWSAQNGIEGLSLNSFALVCESNQRPGYGRCAAYADIAGFEDYVSDRELCDSLRAAIVERFAAERAVLLVDGQEINRFEQP